MRIPVVAGNWKMNSTVDESISIVSNMKESLERITGVDKVICPPFTSLYPIKQLIKESGINLGAQNLYFKEKGAYTGEISPDMVKSLCSYVIIGHSERRQYFMETDEIVNQKVKSALKVGLIPILCIGETLEENQSEKTNVILERQIGMGLKDIETSENIIIAYEPIWAIGTGKAATSDQADSTIGFIRQLICNHWNKKISDAIRILYGGSVNAGNIKELMSKSEIDGALVGGASLKPDEFIEIVKQSSLAKIR